MRRQTSVRGRGRGKGGRWRLLAVGTAGAIGLAACGSSGGGGTTTTAAAGGTTTAGAGATTTAGGGSSASTASASGKSPIKIGISLSLTGDFANNGQGFEQGYKLWAAHVNANGGLLGHPVKLDILNDASSPTQVVTNYQKLISSDHVALTFGPFSTGLTVPSSKIAARYHYAFIEGAGGGPKVFAQGLHNVFDVSLPVADALVPFAKWIASMPASTRPKTAAYPTSNDPFTEPQVKLVQQILEKAGVKTVYSKVFPAEVSQFAPIAGQVAHSGAQVVVLGS
ncbi:MAG: ABC transporter substrate-binding protein, partial [Acidimicrobiales bacterium]